MIKQSSWEFYWWHDLWDEILLLNSNISEKELCEFIRLYNQNCKWGTAISDRNFEFISPSRELKYLDGKAGLRNKEDRILYRKLIDGLIVVFKENNLPESIRVLFSW